MSLEIRIHIGKLLVASGLVVQHPLNFIFTMKPLILTIAFVVIALATLAQGTLVSRTFVSPSIDGNRGGEDPNRRLTIYLPPGYEGNSTERYPVLYFLHGFAANDEIMITFIDFKSLIDSAISARTIRPVIVVLPNSESKYYGSFYSNSEVAGNWADYIGKDVVDYVDKNFRTIANRDSRGLFGHSMGGTGALKMAMLFPDQFSAVYAMSPGAMHFSDDFALPHPSFKRVSQQKSMDSLLNVAVDHDFQNFPFFELIYASLARMYSPNVDEPLLQADQPISYRDGQMMVNADVLKKWEANFPINMVDDHIAQLKSLTALQIDWGRNDEFKHIPVTCREFSKKIEALGINHFAEEYMGNHLDMLGGFEGRIFTEAFPFFERYLKKQPPASPTLAVRKRK